MNPVKHERRQLPSHGLTGHPWTIEEMLGELAKHA
jgi:hypothetical protein